MRLGVVGSLDDPQVKSVTTEIRALGADAVVVDPQMLVRGESVMFDGSAFLWRGAHVNDVRAWWLRASLSPMPPTFEVDETYVLFDDWFEEYMARREQLGFLMSFLVERHYRGIPVVNPPEFGATIQLKAFQLAAAVTRGFAIPRTCTTNDPSRVRDFARQVKHVLYKPSMGGGLAEVLGDDGMARIGQIVRAPVTFQEAVRGTNVRVTLVGEDIVSVVKIPSEALDYRADEDYRAGRTLYEHVDMTPALAEKCRLLARDVGLVMTGIDFIVREGGEWVFLEANPAPIWLDIEKKTGAPISRMLAEYLLMAGQDPAKIRAHLEKGPRSSSFCRYAYPQNPSRSMKR